MIKKYIIGFSIRYTQMLPEYGKNMGHSESLVGSIMCDNKPTYQQAIDIVKSHNSNLKINTVLILGISEIEVEDLL